MIAFSAARALSDSGCREESDVRWKHAVCQSTKRSKLMKIPYSDPDETGSERARSSKKLRDLATDIARLRPQALTRSSEKYGNLETEKLDAMSTGKQWTPLRTTRGQTGTGV